MKKIAFINDLCGFGRCSLTAAIPVISTMGMEACPLPTAILSAQTGFPSYYCDDYTDRMNHFTDEWSKMNVSFDGIYSGYLANPSQIAQVKYFLDRFQKEDTLYLVDPVMGDHGQKYPFFTEELLHGMRELTSRATVITPNLTEACLLAGVSYDDLYAHRYEDDYLLRIQDVAFGFSFSGTGDLFASAICGYLVKGVPLQEAMDKAVDFLQSAIEEATNTGIPRDFGIPFQKYLSRL